MLASLCCCWGWCFTSLCHTGPYHGLRFQWLEQNMRPCWQRSCLWAMKGREWWLHYEPVSTTPTELWSTSSPWVTHNVTSLLKTLVWFYKMWMNVSKTIKSFFRADVCCSCLFVQLLKSNHQMISYLIILSNNSKISFYFFYWHCAWQFSCFPGYSH